MQAWLCTLRGKNHAAVPVHESPLPVLKNPVVQPAKPTSAHTAHVQVNSCAGGP